MKLEKRIFSYFALTLIFIFLTGCSTTKWEWLPEKDKDHYRAEYKEGVKIDVVKVSF
jgi:hypothetical protein